MTKNIKKMAIVSGIILGTLAISSCTEKEAPQVYIEEQEISHTVDTEVKAQTEEFNQYNYVPYSAEKITNATRLNVLFFNDIDSESIKELKANLQQSKIHDWLVMYEIDFNSDSPLKEKYWVTAAHTFVQIDNEGNAIRKWENSKSIEEMHTALTSSKTLVK